MSVQKSVYLIKYEYSDEVHTYGKRPCFLFQEIYGKQNIDDTPKYEIDGKKVGYREGKMLNERMCQLYKKIIRIFDKFVLHRTIEYTRERGADKTKENKSEKNTENAIAYSPCHSDTEK